MLKEAWDSFKDNIKERVTNPFLGTFVLVWIVHNWRIVYSFFYFDKDWKLQQKIDYFKTYWIDNNFMWNLICVALITIGVLIITYLFLALSRFLADYFENIIIPNIQKYSKGKIVTASTHQIALDRISLLEEKIEMERKAKNAIIKERDDLETKLLPKEEENTNTDKADNKFNRIINRALSEFKRVEFEKTMLGISKSSSFPRDAPIVDFLLKNGLIELERKSNTSPIVYYYKFTSLGNDFKKEYFDPENENVVN